MIFVLRLLDKPDSAGLRQRVRPQHTAYLGAVADRIASAGLLVNLWPQRAGFAPAA